MASWPGLRVQPRLADTRRPKALAAEATPWSRDGCTRPWRFWGGPWLPWLSHSLWVLLTLLPRNSCLSFPRHPQVPAPGAHRPPAPGGEPLLGPQPITPQARLSHGVALLALRLLSRERVGGAGRGLQLWPRRTRKFCPCRGAPEMPGGGPPHDCWLHRNRCSGHTATKSVWPIHGGQPSLRVPWKGRPHSAPTPALPLNRQRGASKLLLSSESQSPLL